MTRAEMRALVLFWLDDRDGGYFLTADVNILLDNGQREVQKLLLEAGEDFYTICAETSTVASQRDYALPSDFIKLMRLERITQGSDDTASTERLYPLTRNEIDVATYNTQGASQGLPYNYVINKDTFSVYPVPDSVKTLRLWYAHRVVDIASDGATPDCPEDYHEFIAILAARDCFLKDGRPLSPIESKLGYYEKLLKQVSESRADDSPRMVVATPGGFGSL